MRPTDLKFRSPKEKTPDPRYPQVTCDGRKLTLSCKNVKGTLPLSKRFPQYEVDAKKTGYRIGPGAYDCNGKDLDKFKSKGTPVYKSFHGGKDVTNNGYFFYGHQLVFEPSFLFKTKRIKNDKDLSVDPSFFLTRPKSSKSTNKEYSPCKMSRSSRATSARSRCFLKPKKL